MSCDPIFDHAQGVGTCLACGKNFECGALVFVSNPRPTSDVQERFMSRQEVYHSSTLGPIPLSFTGRRLMQNLRVAVQELLQKRTDEARRGQIGSQDDWSQVSRARGEIAKYMSDMEKRPPSVTPAWRHPDWNRQVMENGQKDATIARLQKENEALRLAHKNITEHAENLRKDNERLKAQQHFVLPAIPKGYKLEIVGPIVSIAPIGKVKPIAGKRK